MPGQSTSLSQIEGGARWVQVGDFTDTFVSLGRVPMYSRKPTLFRQHVRNEVGQVLESYGEVQEFMITLTLQRTQAAILAAVWDEAADETTSISYRSEFGVLTPVSLVAVTDRAKLLTPLTDLTTEYFPNVVAVDIGELQNQITNGDDQPTYTVQLITQARATDPSGQALNSKYVVGWRGDPADAINEGTPDAWDIGTHTSW